MCPPLMQGDWSDCDDDGTLMMAVEVTVGIHQWPSLSEFAQQKLDASWANRIGGTVWVYW